MTGEPGAGKSRLCHEFVEPAHNVTLHYARALSHGRMLPFHVLVALARSLFGVAEGASPSDVRDAVTRGLEDTQPDPIALDFWLDLFGVSDHAPAPSGVDPDERRARLFRSLFDLIRARAGRELTMLWVEDLHWLDSASEAALEMLVERLLAQESAGSKILLLATTRPEYRPGWSARVEGLSLAPLAWEDSRMLLDDWLGPDGRLAPLRARIDARARGNPLFVEEMIRSLVERGVLHGERGDYLAATPSEEIALPETVQAVLASRIDRLADRDKDVLQAAAVVGQDVPIELLRAVVDLPSPELAASLDRLSGAELLGPAETPGEHAFRHPLAQEVAYRTQLLDRRRGTHTAIARALLTIHGPAAATHAALLAHHFDEGGERLEAARWHEQAGRRVARSDPADGARHCRRVTELLAAVPESRETLMLDLTSRIALLEIGRIAGIEEREARGLFDEGGEPLEAARWHEQAGRRVARSDPADGARHCRRVTELLAAVPESRETLMLDLTSRIALLEIGRIAGIEEREARGLFDVARTVAERLQDTAGHAFLLTSYGRLCGLAGDVEQYLTCAEHALELAEGVDARFEFEMRSVLAHAQLAVGRLAPARATAERALSELAQVAGLREAVGRSTAPGLCRVWWALASAHLGGALEAEAALQALLAEESDGAIHVLYGTHAFLCEVLQLRGDLPGALAHGRRAVELAEERGSVFSRVEAAAFLGSAEFANGDTAAATGMLERALALARHRRTALWYEPRILATLADAKRTAGDRSRARALLDEALELVGRGRGWRLSVFDVALAWIRLLASEPAPDRASIGSALDSLDALTAELGSDPYRRMAALERARLAT